MDSPTVNYFKKQAYSALSCLNNHYLLFMTNCFATTQYICQFLERIDQSVFSTPQYLFLKEIFFRKVSLHHRGHFKLHSRVVRGKRRLILK